MIITEKIEGEQYKNLIRYALDTSDAVMVVILNDPSSVHIHTAEEMEVRWKTTFPNQPFPNFAKDNWNRKEKEARANLEIYRTQYPVLVEKMEPYILKKRYNTVWPSHCSDTIGKPYTIAFYKACEEIYELLLEPKAYDAWRYPYYPHDLSFFKDGKAWLYGCSHESYVEFEARSQEDYDAISALGISLHEPFREMPVDQWYVEQY